MTLSNTNPAEINSIATHPHAESQCRSFIAKNYPNAQIIESSSTAAAAKGLSKGDYDAAIAGDEKTINVHVSHLRDKVEPDPNKPRFVLTVRGVGYSFSDRSDRGERSGA
jgi:prephenate dehydratase